MPKRRPLKELYVEEKLTEETVIWMNEEVYEDPEETIEAQENRIKKYKTDREKHFTGRREGRRNVDIDLVPHAS